MQSQLGDGIGLQSPVNGRSIRASFLVITSGLFPTSYERPGHKAGRSRSFFTQHLLESSSISGRTQESERSMERLKRFLSPGDPSSSSSDANSSSRNSGQSPQHHPSGERNANPERLNLNQIRRATGGFSDSHKLGEGDFGIVYKAELPGGRIVAVKRATGGHLQGLRTFQREIDLLRQIHHRCLVKIFDFVDEGNERIIVSEFVPNGNLREHLDGLRGNRLTFGQRLGIAIDVAEGLNYLHSSAERVIIHRGVKSTNILLMDALKAKVADFGLAKAKPTEEGRTHITTKARGTFGYIDPEYAETSHLSPKSDVFSYGVLLAEIVSGRRPVDSTRPQHDRVTIKWAFNKFKEGRQKEILDPLITEEVDGEVLTRILALAFRCARNTRSERPSMREVVSELRSIQGAFNR